MNPTYKDLVSIIMPAYNSEEYISESINSIINQTYQNWELLITDDCSNDDTVEVVKKCVLNDKRVKLFKLTENSGAGVARNNGIRYAKGRYIAFCDSDDTWKPQKLEKQLNFLKSKNLSFTFCSYDVTNKNGDFIKTIKAPAKLSFSKLLKNNYVGCLTAIYDQESLGKLYMSEIRMRQDWTLWLKILKLAGNTSGQLESLALYRDRSKSISSNKFKMIKYTWLVYSSELGFPIIKSFSYMIKFFFFYFKKNFKT